MEEGFRLIKRVDITVASPNVDLHYGPYTSVTEANREIVLGLRAVGKVVGIVSGTEVLDYHWRNGITDEDLVQKSSVTEAEKATWNGKQDKSGNDGIRYVLFNGGLVPDIDTNTNIINTDLTQTANRNHDLGAKKLKFTNGDFEVPALTLTETAENSKPNKVGTPDGLKLMFTDKDGINRKLAFDEFTTQIISTGGNYNSLEVTADLLIFTNTNAQAILNGIWGKSDFHILNLSPTYEVRINHNSGSVTGGGQPIMLPTASGNMGVKGTARILKTATYGYFVADTWGSKYRPEFTGLTETL